VQICGDWRLLNFVSVLRELVPKDASKIDIVQNDHVRVVFFGVVVLPAFVPPTETDNCRPPT
jgi:hypothetical protein